MKKKLAILLAVAMIMAMLPTTVFAARTYGVQSAAFAPGGYEGKTVVLYTGNIRGQVAALPLIAAVRADFEAQGADVILVDTGNFLQGTRYSSFNSGSTIITLMLAAGYDIVALGTYDFAFGTGTLGTAFHGDAVDFGPLGELLEMNPGLQAVSANISGQNSYFHSFTANVTMNSGITLGFFGLTDVATPGRILESNLAGIRFTCPVEAAQGQAEYLAGNDLIIGLSNASVAYSSDSAVYADGALGAEDPAGVSTPAVIMLEAASVPAPPLGGITMGAVVIDNTTLTYTRRVIDLADFTPDSAVAGVVSEFMEVVDAALPLVGQSAVMLDGSVTSNRSGETSLGNLWADALRWFAVSGEINAFFHEDDVAAGNDRIHVADSHVVALWNAGNLRDFVYPGDVTVQDLRRVLPFPNTVAVVYLTGVELLEQLEASAQGLPFSPETYMLGASFMHVSGIEYTVDATRAFNPGEAYRDRIWHRAESVERVTITSINGAAFDPAAIYAVITSNANFNGMDISYVLVARESDVENRSAITTARVTDHAVAGFIASLPGQTIGQDYAQAHGRITVIGADAAVAGDGAEDGLREDETDIPSYEGAGINVTRGGFVDMLFRMVGPSAVDSADEMEDDFVPRPGGENVGMEESHAEANRFVDVPSTHLYADAIAWATQQGFVNGVSATLFAPDRYITRQEVAVIIHRFMGTNLVDGELNFDDAASVARWAYAAVFYVTSNGIMPGEGLFTPAAFVSIAAAEEIMANMRGINMADING